MTFGEKIKIVRQRLFLSQEAMAKKMNVAFSTLNRWERGHAKPNYKAQAAFDKICKDNGITLDERYGG